MIGVKVNIGTDLSAGVLLHNVLLPPAIPVPVPSVSLELPVNQDWLPGELNNQHKRTTTVRHSGRSIVLEGHDCGALIMDVTPLFPANAYYLLMWPFSSRKILFSASTVQADTAPIGCAAAWLPMMTCGDPLSGPTALALTSMRNTVEVGMTGADVAIGLAYAAASVALDLIFNKISGAGIVQQVRQAASRSALRAASGAAARRAAWAAGGRAVREPARRVVVRTVRRELPGRVVGFDSPASAARRGIAIGIDSAASHARAGEAHAPNAGDWTATHTVGVPFANASGSVTASDNADRRGTAGQGSLGNRQVAITPAGDLVRTRNSVTVATPVDDTIPAPVRVRPPRGGHHR
ncbi:MAG: hypothetical protein Q7V43_03305 [Myxococcales bacterium]|nr:hypothetical protein [Myxococcales bacterium]